jgi:hypothetical protein
LELVRRHALYKIIEYAFTSLGFKTYNGQVVTMSEHEALRYAGEKGGTLREVWRGMEKVAAFRDGVKVA